MRAFWWRLESELCMEVAGGIYLAVEKGLDMYLLTNKILDMNAAAQSQDGVFFSFIEDGGQFNPNSIRAWMEGGGRGKNIIAIDASPTKLKALIEAQAGDERPFFLCREVGEGDKRKEVLEVSEHGFKAMVAGLPVQAARQCSRKSHVLRFKSVKKLVKVMPIFVFACGLEFTDFKTGGKGYRFIKTIGGSGFGLPVAGAPTVRRRFLRS